MGNRRFRNHNREIIPMSDVNILTGKKINEAAYKKTIERCVHNAWNVVRNPREFSPSMVQLCYRVLRQHVVYSNGK
jgi:hypothetical protein